MNALTLRVKNHTNSMLKLRNGMKTNSLTYAAIAILTVLSMSSCTVDEDFSDLENSAQPAAKERTVQDNTPENKEEIVFKVQSDSETKSESGQNMSKFKITAYEDGFNYYNGQTDEVTTADNGISWTSDCNRYWPTNRPSDWTGLTFYAYAESKSQNSTYIDNYSTGNLDCSYSIPRIKNFKVNDEVGEQRNLLYAIATGVKNTSANKEVNLNFKNALSKVSFTVSNDDPNISNIEILSIELGGVKGEGDFQFPDYAALANKSVVFESDRQGKWIIPEGTPDQSYILNDINLNLGTAGSSKNGAIAEELLLIPQKVEEIKDQSAVKGGYIKITVKLTPSGSNKAQSAKEYTYPISIDWQEGHSYTYSINWTTNITIIGCRESNN